MVRATGELEQLRFDLEAEMARTFTVSWRS